MTAKDDRQLCACPAVSLAPIPVLLCMVVHKWKEARLSKSDFMSNRMPVMFSDPAFWPVWLKKWKLARWSVVRRVEIT